MIINNMKYIYAFLVAFINNLNHLKNNQERVQGMFHLKFILFNLYHDKTIVLCH